MTDDSQLQTLATATAEEILRAIYGDDFAGCNVSLESISAIVYRTLSATATADRSLLELYEKSFEALNLLATPPANGRALASAELQALLGERLDTIRTFIAKVTDVTAAAKAKAAGQQDD